MHWPIGAPRLYEQAIPSTFEAVTFDGLNNGVQTGTDRNVEQQTSEVDEAHRVETPHIIQEISQEQEVHRKPQQGVEKDSNQEEQQNAQRATDEQGTRDTKPDSSQVKDIIGVRVTRNGHLFATITATSLTIWQTKPTAIIASVSRSNRSLNAYGSNTGLVFRPDGTILVVYTSRGFLITYSIIRDFEAPAYQLLFKEADRRHVKRRGINHFNGYGEKEESSVLDGSGLFHKIQVRFRMVVHIDAGIREALALDDEIIIATENPPALQCLKWIPSDRAGSQSTTQLLSSFKWLQGKGTLNHMVFDKPMSLFTWVTSEGQAYAVQQKLDGRKESQNSSGFFNGHIFHKPDSEDEYATYTAINSRFSLIAVGCNNGRVYLYNVRDYSGGIILMKEFTPSVSYLSSGALTTLSYSPDGYCLFAGYERGWMTWSVYGQVTGSSFGSDRHMAQSTEELWLTGVQHACWMASGLEVALICPKSFRIYMLEFARSAVAGCFTSANMERGLLQTSDGVMIYQGHNTSDLTSITTDMSLWLRVQYPIQYLLEQWPIRSAAISSDGRYVAIAGQRGLAHYSTTSGRWKTFEDPSQQDEFFVRGGLCWYHHLLIAAVESSTSHEIRLYSREHPLNNSHVLHVVRLEAAVVHLTLSGDDSILVYTQSNILDHYIIVTSRKAVRLVKVGQIALHGIIRSPARVRSVSWIVPDDQLRDGDPSQDVAVSSIIFLIDGKLVLLQPSTTEAGDLKYDMRFIGHDVEYYVFVRNYTNFEVRDNTTALGITDVHSEVEQNLCNSLWVFDGAEIKVWTDIHDLLLPPSSDSSRELPEPVGIAVDFYPLSPLLDKGILFGIEPELVQRRDGFASFRAVDRTTLFLPDILRYHLSTYDTPAALRLSHAFRHLPYFPHALEVLLHNVLDEEVDQSPDEDHAMLPAVLAFLSTFPEYLEIVVQCTRKTEVRSWKTLFAHLPPPHDLFEASMAKGDLKTAGGYLLVLHTLAEINSDAPEVIRLLRAARQEQDWELCKELARFLMALDESGATLEKALQMMDLGETSSLSSASANGRQDSMTTVVRSREREGITLASLPSIDQRVQGRKSVKTPIVSPQLE